MTAIIDKTNPLHVRYMLNMNDDYVKDSIYEIYNQQSSYEKRHGITVHKNSRGFRTNHAKQGTEFALMVLNKEDFSFNDMNDARELILHYVNQLIEIYKEKEIIKNMREKRIAQEAIFNLQLNSKVDSTSTFFI